MKIEKKAISNILFIYSSDYCR